MFISKIKRKESGILLYGITPPKAVTAVERLSEIALKTMGTISSLDIDALIVYDVQDESARTTEARPFPFSSSLDPFVYASEYLHALPIPKIIYRPASNFTKEELFEWLQVMTKHRFYPVFVGLPSPDYIPKTSLKDAYEIWRGFEEQSVIGAVMIPERHALLKDEDVRILDKIDSGVSYFISQCIFNVEYTKRVLDDLLASSKRKQQELPTMIFTLTVCGSAKTLDFMEWLGIHVPEDIKEELKASVDPLSRSVEMAIVVAKELITYCTERSIPFGFNIESVAIRKVEIEASISLINSISEILKQKGIRKAVKVQASPDRAH